MNNFRRIDSHERSKKRCVVNISRNRGYRNINSNLYDVPIHVISSLFSKPDFYIEVYIQELRGVVACSKDFVISNIPGIQAKYRKGSHFRDDTKEGVSVYKLHDFEFTLVRDFIKGIYRGKLDCDQPVILEYYRLADYFQCLEIKEATFDFIAKNMNFELLLHAIDYGAYGIHKCS